MDLLRRDLVPLDDSELIGIGYQEGVRPIMMLAPVNAEMNFDSQIAHDMFVNEAAKVD